MVSRGLRASSLSLGLSTLLLAASVCSAVNILPYQVPFLEALTKSQNFSAETAAGLGWTDPWSCKNTTGVICDARGNLLSLILPGTGTGAADDSCTLLPADASGVPKNCPFPYKLSGQLPASIGNLTALTLLDLSANFLNGSIPASIYNLTKLQTLKLGSNFFIQTLPKNLSRLTNLESLDLSYSLTFKRHTLPDALSALSKLTKLALASLNANGTIPDSYSQLTSLSFLNLAFNNLTGPLPPFLGSLTGLVDLVLQQNNFTGSIPKEIANLSQLTRLQLRLNDLNGSVPAELSKLTTLQWLDLGSNADISGDLPASLSQLPNIKQPDSYTGSTFIILKSNTSATCPRPTKKKCMGPPAVNTTSQFCQWVCLTFCTACADGNYVKGNSSGTDVGGQPVVATVLAPPPPKSSPESPTGSSAPGTPSPDDLVPVAYPPPAPSAAETVFSSWIPGACTILAAVILSAFTS